MVRRRQSAGYNLVALVVGVTVLSILAAAAMPLWSTAIRRDKEEELISRGLQYAEAIRVFQRRFGRYPVRLSELLEVKPRSIRQLWKDPITDSRRWGLVLVGGPGEPITGTGPGSQFPPGPGGSPGNDPEAPEGGEPQTGPVDDGGETPPGETPGFGTPQPPAGPIRGVHSLSRKESIKLFFDRSRYDKWEFTVELMTAPLSVPGQMAVPRVNALQIGRPFRVQNPTAPTPGGLPGGGQPGRPPRNPASGAESE